jgi:hypothetical protein
MSRIAPFTTAVMAYTLLGMALARAAWGERRAKADMRMLHGGVASSVRRTHQQT